MIVIIDYGMGNLKSVFNAFCALGATVSVSSDPSLILNADRIVLPGVGAFGDAMAELKSRNLTSVIDEVIARKKPFLGICLGLQLLYASSEENYGIAGLNILDGSVKKFLFSSGEKRKVPHMGWNSVAIKNEKCPLLKGVAQNAFFYFVHSYYAELDSRYTLASTEYGIDFSSIVWKDNVFATQFHPEKSQDAGLTVLKNFMEL
jgi:glutamine amidotransferase